MKLTKEDIDKVRHIDGFPIAKDDDIIALSAPPYYTACPNPFIEDFIKENGKPYDEAKDYYHRGPYTEDVEEDKHDLIYNIHSYHTKVPPKAIMHYIKHYTEKDNIVLDGFCGSGMTGVAAQLLGNELGIDIPTILLDLSPYATFIASNYNNPNYNYIIEEINECIEEISSAYGDKYLTKHCINGIVQMNINGQPVMGTINYIVWSDVFFCPNCSHEMIYYESALDPLTLKVQKKINCPKCNIEITKSNMILKQTTTIDNLTGKTVKHAVKIPVLINYSVGKKRYIKKPDETDIHNACNNIIDKWYPTSILPLGYNTQQPKKSHRYNSVDKFYTNRTLFFLSKFYEKFQNDNKKMFLFTSVLPKLTLLNRYMPEHGSRALVGPMVGTYYIPSLSVENNILNQMKFQLKKLRNLNYTAGKVIVSTQSTTDLRNIPSNSIDYIFVDPPFGSNIMYSELNFMPESWLGVKTNNVDEAVVNNIQDKSVIEYSNLMTKCFSELFRVLKPNRWITIEFHNSKNAIWNAIQESVNVAGFIIADVRTLNKEKKTIMQYKSDNTIDQDLVISAYKPKIAFRQEFINKIGSEETAWSFVRQHLEKLPVVVIKNGKIELVEERKAYLLYDRMVAYHVINGIPVPLDATDFYRGLDERFLKRDGMYFLSDQVNEYDTERIINDEEPLQMELLVTNEKSAIAWLYNQLEIPQTYAELQPKFMQEIRAWDKFEKRPELSILLEENFLQDNEGKWYIPNVTKASDVAKLREKKLLKEFEGYLATKGKLKLFRTEAIRVGFAKLWDNKNYKLIVETAERLPESVIQEDDKLLMYYDLSLGRI
jgi:DNA modification methylase/DNA-directed RNA polymerase subunit M/transcription elongation factor TFIIS